MKKLLTLMLGLCFLSLDIQSQDVSISGPDAIIARQKMTCGTTEEGKTRYGMWEGRAYSRVPGEKDKHLFNVVGVNTRQCRLVNDDVRGLGYKSVSREIMMYLDPETDEIIDVWTNPWNGKEVDIVHVANDPVNMRGISYEKDKEGNYRSPVTVKQYGDVTYSAAEIPLFYENPLGSDYQAYVGGAYHAMEIFNSSYKSSEILDSNVKTLSESHIAWTRVAQWLPWMQMGDKNGIMIFNATGFSTFDQEKIWPRLMDILTERYPMYLTPPPIDDERPNETSWTVFKKYMEDKEPAKVGGH